jgi:hypothetical protein
MLGFNRLEIVKKYVARAESVERTEDGVFLILVAKTGRHTITARFDTEKGALANVTLDQTEALGINDINTRLAREVYEGLEKRRAGLEKVTAAILNDATAEIMEKQGHSNNMFFQNGRDID